MNVLAKWENIINEIMDNKNHPLHGWLNEVKSGINSYEDYVRLEDEFKNHKKSLDSEVEGKCLSQIWSAQRRYYFEEIYLEKAKENPEHLLHNSILILEFPISSYSDFVEKEKEWKKVCRLIEREFPNPRTALLIKTALSKKYTEVKNIYCKELLPNEFSEPSFPMYDITKVLAKRENITPEDIAFIREEFDRIKIFIDKHEGTMKTTLGKVFYDNWKEFIISYYKTKGAVSAWDACVLYIKDHDEWGYNRDIVDIFESSSASQEDLDMYQAAFTKEDKKRKEEVNDFEHIFFENEFKKKGKRLANRVEIKTDIFIGEWIKAAREKQGLSFKKLEELSGVSASFIHRVEIGERNAPDLNKLMKIAKALKISPKEVFEMMPEAELLKDKNTTDILNWLTFTYVRVGDQVLKPEQQKNLIKLIELIFETNWDENPTNNANNLIRLIKKIR